jgi:catechol 2,3-dioxygenase-like lactoylglutathione lyase family enzyme
MNDRADPRVAGRSAQISRRTALAMLGLAIAPEFGSRAWAQAAGPEATPLPLPLKIQRICGHLGVSVPDVTKSALFYSKVFGGESVSGEQKPFLRYMINLEGGPLRLGEGGGVAIGKLGTLGSVGQTKPLIDHFCLNAAPFDDAAWRARLKVEGLVYHAQGVFSDIDNIAVQISGAQGGESLSAGEIERMPPLYTGAPLVHPKGYAHIMVHVSNLERSVRFYEKMFGLKVARRSAGVVYFSDGETELALKQVAAGEKPNIHHYAVKVPAFDHAKVSRGLTALGAVVTPAKDEAPHILRFADPDGLIVELWPI